MLRQIKRYKNRKLYDVSHACYVNLGEVMDIVVKGDDVVVMDVQAGRDVTVYTLAQAISHSEFFPNPRPLMEAIRLYTLRPLGSPVELGKLAR